jgi:hypothetical protein
VIWVYAICDRPERPAPPPLEGCSAGGVLAVFARDEHEPTPEALWAQERVLEQLMSDRAVLPLRFGTRLEDEDALRAVLAADQARFHEALARVRGRVELGVRVRAPEAPAPAGGREYLLGKLRLERDAAELHAPLAELAVEARRRPAAGDLLRAAYLVDAHAVDAFRAAVERLQRAHPGLTIVCTGPWPAYSFVQ